VIEWASDPKTLALLLTGFSQLAISVWAGREMWSTLKAWEKWRLEELEPWRRSVDTAIGKVQTQSETSAQEIERLRDGLK